MVIAVGCPALGLCFKVRVATFQGQASACGGVFATTRLTRSETTTTRPKSSKAWGAHKRLSCVDSGNCSQGCLLHSFRAQGTV